MFSIEPLGLHGAKEKLRTIGVGASIGHRQNARPRMFKLEVLICKFRTVNRFTPSAISRSEVASLAHEFWDYAMESAAFEVQSFSRLARTLLTGAQAAEVLRGFRGDISTQLHDNTASGSTANRHIEKYFWVCHLIDAGFCAESETLERAKP